MRTRILLARNSKIPAVPGSWKTSTDPEEVKSWIARRYNVGAVTEGITVWDGDAVGRCRQFLEQYEKVITTAWKTRRGVHVVFSGEVATTQQDGYDIKSGPMSYVVCPPSIVDGIPYRYLMGDLDTSELPPFPEELKATPRAITRKVRDAARYVMAIESIQGTYGSKGLVRACSVLRDGGYTEAQAMVILLQWNSSGKVQPPWSPDELARACSNTYLKRGV